MPNYIHNKLSDAKSHIKAKFHDFPKKVWNVLTPGCPPACRYTISGGRRRKRTRRRRRRRRTRRRARRRRRRRRTRKK